MCGIIGYIGSRKASEIVLNGLKRLEYRGYDSSGISTIEKNKQLLTTKCAGKIVELEESLEISNAIEHVNGHKEELVGTITPIDEEECEIKI